MNTCTRCLQRARYQSLVICEECARDLVARRVTTLHSDGTVVEPAWLRRMREQGLPAKDYSRVA